MTAMTELFYRDPYAREFTSRVTSCEEGERGFEIMLEDTAFYPEGGGQPADHGTLDGAAVFDVRRTPAGIVHYCEKALEVGQDVKGVLDWSGASTTCRTIRASMSFRGSSTRSSALTTWAFTWTTTSSPATSAA